MRGLRLSLLGTCVLLLLFAPGTAVAEDAPPPAGSGPVVVTGTLEVAAPSSGGPATDLPGHPTVVHIWTASDPRLSGLTFTADLPLYALPAEDATQRTAGERPAVYEVTNADGSWGCIAAYQMGPIEAREPAHVVVLHGTGAYEGLSAVVQVDWSQAPFAFEGLIVAGTVPVPGVLPG